MSTSARLIRHLLSILLFWVGITLFSGFGVEIIVLALPLTVLQIAVFFQVPNGGLRERIQYFLTRSAVFALIVSGTIIVWIWFTSPGRLGSGHAILIEGRTIFPAGYLLIFTSSIATAAIAAASVALSHKLTRNMK